MSTWLRLIAATVSVSLVALSCGGNSTTAPTDVKSGLDASVGEEPAAGATLPAALHIALLRQQQTAPGYDFLPAGDGVLHSRGGLLDVAAQPAGVHLAQGSGSTAFSLGVATTSVGRTDGSVLSRAVVGQRAEGQELVVSHDGDVEERFLSGPVGLEQSYTLTRRPTGTGAVAIQVMFDGLTPELIPGTTDHVRLNGATGEQRGGYSDLVAVDASGRSLEAKMEVSGGGVSLVIDDSRATYPVQVDPIVWSQQAELNAFTFGATDGASNDWFGFSVSVSGSLAIIGAPNHTVGANAGAGAAYVFLQTGTSWALQAELNASTFGATDGAAGDGFGSSVAVSGALAIIGAPYHASGAKSESGAAYVFAQNGTAWTLQKELSAFTGGATDGAAGDNFGNAVSISASATTTAAIVGSPNHAVGTATGVGAAYVYVQSGTTWPLQAEFNPISGGATGGAAGDAFGTSVAITTSATGSSAVVGAPYHTVGSASAAGAAYAFGQTGTTWPLQTTLFADNGAANDGFGTSVSVSGSTALVGAPYHKANGHSQAGGAYLFNQNGDAWALQQDLTAGDGKLGDLFGFSVSVNGSTAVVGAYQHDVVTTTACSASVACTGAGQTCVAGFCNNISAGAAYMFSDGCTGWTADQEVTAADGATDDVFGFSVATTGGTTAIVGAYSHNANSDVSSGSTYVYSGVSGAATCCISGTSYAAGTVNPADVCEVCTPATSTTAWSNEPNGTSCATGEVCSAGTCVADCFIGGVLIPGGTVNPANACQICTPATSTTTWSSEPNGTGCATGEVCSSGACVADCFIGGVLIPGGTVNPANACQVCTPATSTTTWSSEPNGTACATGEVCSSGTCATDCFIGGVVIPGGAVNPANACEVCTPATSTTTWSNEPNGTTCATGEVCSSGACTTDCFIGGVLIPAGTVNPANACQVCTPATSTTTWSGEPNGTSCASGEVCSSSACVADCFIGGVLIPAGTVDPANACQVCTPATSTTTWSNEPNGTTCASGEVCSSGACTTDCFIGGVLIPAGTVNPANACEVCTPATSTTTWSGEPNGTSCASGEVCSSSACVADCFIGGVLIPGGTVDPANACQVCAPATSTTTWSNEPNGLSCGAGEVCTSGTCATDCFIGGILVPAGMANPANACQVCAPASSTTTWSNDPDGTSCGSGDVCSSGACSADCFIGGTLFPAGTVNPANACQVCTPATSTTTWSNDPDGTSCGSGDVCSSGACTPDCFIGGVLIPAGTVNPANACQVCTPATSTTTWSNDPDGTSCAAGEVCSSGTCATDCFIGGTLYPSGTVNPANSCQVCTPSTSTTTWSNESDGSSCGASGEVCSSGTCASDCFIGGTLYPSGTVNTADACQVCAPGTSTSTWSNEPDGTGCGSGEVCSTGACSSDCFIGGVLIPSGTVNPANACQVCTPATSTTTWSNEPNGADCGSGEICSSGTCGTECFIGGVVIPSGTVNSANACQVCSPGVSTTTWSNEPNGLSCGSGEVCGTGSCLADCFVAGVLYPAGTVNPVNACQVCTPATSTTAWTNESNGTSCGSGEICSSGTCGTECFIGGTVYPSGTVNPANACQVCSPGLSTTTWTNEPSGTACGGGEVCSTVGTCASDCFIAGTLVAAGAVNPANACEVCTPATSTTTWSNEPNGLACGTGDVCSSGACTADCFIGGVLYPSGTVNSADACQICAPTSSTTAWSNEPNGMACGAGEVCGAGVCAPDCFIGGTLFPAGTVNPADACQVCAPATSTTTWSNEPDGSGCGVNDVCSSGTCASDCFIAGILYPAGTVNPANACQVCAPATSTTTWSNESDGLSCATGEVCSSGACSADCFIGGTLFSAGTVNPADACEVCTPATSTTTWSNEPDGSSCGTGEVCTAGACASDCFIGGVVFPSGTVNPANACQVCTPATSTTTWSNEPSGTGCASGEVCSSSGTCATDCFIGGTLYPSGTVNPANACQVCTPATSTTAWSNEPSGTACASGEVCSSTGTCATDCFIGGTLYPSGTVNPINACQVCTPATSTTAWSNESNGSTCGGGEVCSAGVCGTECFIGGTVFPSGTVNPANACQVCSPGLSTTTWSNEPSGTGCASGEVCSSTGTCASDCFIGGVLYPSGTVNPANACLVCTPAHSTTAWSNEPSGTSCGSGQVCGSGTCAPDCFIGGTLYPSGTVNPINACQVCTPATSTTTWSNESNGTVCGSGQICSSGTCGTECFIGGTVFPSGTVNPANACQVCSPGLSTTAWSNEPGGTSCGAGEVCGNSGTCGADCFIQGTLIPSGTVNPANACEVCAPVSATSTWSNAINGTSCNDGNACTQTDTCQAGACTGSNPVTCTASDQCHAVGICNPSTGACSNPTDPNGTTCNDGNACSANDMCTNGACGGTAYTCVPSVCQASSICNGTGSCTITQLPDGTSCGSGEACFGGACVTVVPDAGTPTDAGGPGAEDGGGATDSGTPSSDDGGEDGGASSQDASADGGLVSDGGTGTDAASSVDAGADAGQSGSDAGNTEDSGIAQSEDAGATGEDAGASAPDGGIGISDDSGVALSDAAVGAEGEEAGPGLGPVGAPGGCGCTVVGESSHDGHALFGLLGLVLVAARRRRRSR